MCLFLILMTYWYRFRFYCTHEFSLRYFFNTLLWQTWKAYRKLTQYLWFFELCVLRVVVHVVSFENRNIGHKVSLIFLPSFLSLTIYLRVWYTVLDCEKYLI